MKLKLRCLKAVEGFFDDIHAAIQVDVFLVSGLFLGSCIVALCLMLAGWVAPQVTLALIVSLPFIAAASLGVLGTWLYLGAFMVDVILETGEVISKGLPSLRSFTNFVPKAVLVVALVGGVTLGALGSSILLPFMGGLLSVLICNEAMKLLLKYLDARAARNRGEPTLPPPAGGAWLVLPPNDPNGPPPPLYEDDDGPPPPLYEDDDGPPPPLYEDDDGPPPPLYEDDDGPPPYDDLPAYASWDTSESPGI